MKYKVQVSATTWTTYEVEADSPIDAARMGWNAEIDEKQVIKEDGRIENVEVFAGDDVYNSSPFVYDLDAAYDGEEEN